MECRIKINREESTNEATKPRSNKTEDKQLNQAQGACLSP